MPNNIIKQIFVFVKREIENKMGMLNLKVGARAQAPAVSPQELRARFDRIYTDGLALRYISAYWSGAKTERSIKWLDATRGALRDCFWRESGAAEDFIEFAEDARGL